MVYVQKLIIKDTEWLEIFHVMPDYSRIESNNVLCTILGPF